MRKNHRIKLAADLAILLSSLIFLYAAYSCQWLSVWPVAIPSVCALCGILAIADMVCQLARKNGKAVPYSREEKRTGAERIGRLILLDEQDKPIKSWDMAGRISIIIGREGGGEDVDVDLEDCAFGSFIDFQHAVLNFCLDQWYVEDLGSQNGVKIQKAEDGECYKVMGRPCRVGAGDVLYIANTKLLLS
ncbi:FHA domain-containing protein [Clostridiaceae bacterium]|mgnify:CR=1 FL=1|nr:FHA domain-containing protein [Clostridiaceae bacterium]